MSKNNIGGELPFIVTPGLEREKGVEDGGWVHEDEDERATSRSWSTSGNNRVHVPIRTENLPVMFIRCAAGDMGDAEGSQDNRPGRQCDLWVDAAFLGAPHLCAGDQPELKQPSGQSPGRVDRHGGPRDACCYRLPAQREARICQIVDGAAEPPGPQAWRKLPVWEPANAVEQFSKPADT